MQLMKRSTCSTIAALFLLIGLSAGCGPGEEDETDTGMGPDTGMMADSGDSCEKKPPSMPAAHACWHVCAETPIEVDAATDSSGTVPTVQFGKTYAISLNDDGSGEYTGTVRFNAGEMGREAIADGETKEIHFHTVADVAMKVTPKGSTDEIALADTNEYQCDQGLKYSKVFELESKEYDVTISPIDREEITLVIVPLNGPGPKK
jgi:hypothetical protein